MAKSKKRKSWVIVMVITLIISGILFFPQTNALGALVTPTIVPTATLIIPICLVGPDPDCLEKPKLALGPDGKWAYYFLNGVYFEFPSNWSIQPIEPINNALRILPSLDSPEGSNIIDITFSVLPNMNIEQNNAFIFTQYRDYAKWKYLVSVYDFQGVEFLWGDSDSSAVLEISLYNERDPIAVDLQAIITGHQILEMIDGHDIANEIFPNIQHMVESIRIWKRTTMNEHQIGISIINYDGHKNPP